MAASQQSLAALHEALARAFADIVDNGVKVQVKKGDEYVVETITAPAAYLNTVRQFLKDNNIECAHGKPSEAMQGLLTTLPFAGDDHPANMRETD